jgi:hypothetical protein
MFDTKSDENEEACSWFFILLFIFFTCCRIYQPVKQSGMYLVLFSAAVLFAVFLV